MKDERKTVSFPEFVSNYSSFYVAEDPDIPASDQQQSFHMRTREIASPSNSRKASSSHKSPMNQHGERWVNQDDTDSDNEHDRFAYKSKNDIDINDNDIVDVKLVSLLLL